MEYDTIQDLRAFDQLVWDKVQEYLNDRDLYDAETVLDFTIAYDNLILTENQINPKYAITTKLLGNGFFVNTNISTTHKAEILSEISEKLGLGLIVTIE